MTKYGMVELWERGQRRPCGGRTCRWGCLSIARWSVEMWEMGKGLCFGRIGMVGGQHYSFQ
jgi:hypothetical protein